MERRQYLATAVTVGVSAVAGCAGDSGGSDDGTTDDDGNENAAADGSSDDTGSTADVSVTEMERLSREFLELLIAGSFGDAYEQVTPSFEQSVPQERLDQQWERDITPLGEFERFSILEYRGEKGNFDVVEAQGEFADGAASFEVQFDGERIAGLIFNTWSPPAYVDETRFGEEQLTLSAPDGCELGATLTVPDGDDTVPGVVLVHGSGDQGREQQVGPNRTFRELAWGLATRGTAVLRYDQRTVACDVDRTAATVDDLITDDALTAIERLRARERIGGVFVAGHSLGGRLAPRIADRDGELAGVIMLAPLAEPLHEAIVRQSEYQFDIAPNMTESQREQQLAQVQTLAERLRTLDIGENETIDLGGGDRGRPFFRTLQEYDHVATAAGLETPRFILQGERDFLVTVEDDLPIWEAELGGDPGVRIKRYPDLNHRFQPGEGQARPSEWLEPTPVAKAVIEDVAAFTQNSGLPVDE